MMALGKGKCDLLLVGEHTTFRPVHIKLRRPQSRAQAIEPLLIFILIDWWHGRADGLAQGVGSAK